MAFKLPRLRIHLTIGAKLVGLIACLLLVSVAGLVSLSTWLYSEDSKASIQQMNHDTALGLATRIRENFETVTTQARMLGTVMMQETMPVAIRDSITGEFFDKDHDFLAVVIHHRAPDGSFAIQTQARSPELAPAAQGSSDDLFAVLAGNKDFSFPLIAQGEVLFASARLWDGTPAIFLGLPFIAVAPAAGSTDGKPKDFSHTLTVVLRQSKLIKAVSDSDAVTSYLVDQHGHLVAHPDANRALAAEDLSQLQIIRMMLAGNSSNGQTRYVDPLTGEPRLAAFQLVGMSGLGVVSEVPEAKAFEAAESVKRKSLYIAAIILCLSFLAGYLYSGTITWPLKQLVAASHRIANGDFATELVAKGRDEVAMLSLAFNDMTRGLKERDQVKEVFNKFHNKEVAERLLSGDVKLGGERREATIFFSDVRGFTSMSESMEPEQVVEMLNEYMTRMVRIIREHHGIVDKYVGDAIMAIWGVPVAGTDDVANAVKASLAMRVALAELNALRISRGQNALLIGMGLNTGQVIAGNIGSHEKMEYTVIGDAVNLASRMESMTKEYGTDLLIPKSVQERLEGRFVFEQCQSAKVKGKAQAIEIFKVRGLINAQGREVIMETPYSTYGAEKSDKVVHQENAPARPAPVPPPFRNPGAANLPPGKKVA